VGFGGEVKKKREKKKKKDLTTQPLLSEASSFVRRDMRFVNKGLSVSCFCKFPHNNISQDAK
jgi:hypothetical protein